MQSNNSHNEQALIQGCIRNERRSQELLYRQYFATMLQMCLRYTDGDREAAMEIVNNGMLKVFKKIDTYAGTGSLEGWVRRIVYHSMADYFKAQPKIVHFMVFEERDMQINERALDNMYYEDLLSMVNQLPPATRQVFELYAIEGMSHVEIAANTGISVGTSKWHLSSAREKLKALIETQHPSYNYQNHAR